MLLLMEALLRQSHSARLPELRLWLRANRLDSGAQESLNVDGMDNNNEIPSTPLAWQPLTPRGVAAFAYASFTRLFVFQFIFASLAAGMLIWLLYVTCFPVVQRSLPNLPDKGQIRGGRLEWSSEPAMLLAEGRVLAFSVDLEHSGKYRVPADLMVEFGTESLRLYSLAGYAEWKYRSDAWMSFNRPELEPWWGAWRAPILWLTFLGWVVATLALWTLMAFIYAPVVWLVAFYANRQATFKNCWKLAGASMMPANVVLFIGLLLYTTAAIGLVGLLLVAGLHILAGWIYLFVAPFWLERDPSVPVRKNPFASNKPA